MHPVVPVSRVFARLNRWKLTAWVLSLVRLSKLDSDSVGRITYALMMMSREHPEQAVRLLERVRQRNRRTTPELDIEIAAMASSIGDVPTANTYLTQAAQRATNPYTTDAAQRLLALNHSYADGSLLKTISMYVEALILPGTPALVTLVPLSSRYLDLWKLWLEQVRKHIGENVVVLALDEAALAATQHEAGVFPVDLREWFAWNAQGSLHSRSRGVLWLFRVLVLRELVLRGNTALVLDLDAIVLSDLVSMLDELPAADVIAQQDHSLPMDVNRQLGFVLCCGCMLWRPTPAALSLLDRFATETAIERDDQMALNHILAREGLTNQQTSAVCLSFQSTGVRFVCPDSSSVSRTLHSGTVVRHFLQEGKSIAEVRKTLGLD